MAPGVDGAPLAPVAERSSLSLAQQQPHQPPASRRVRETDPPVIAKTKALISGANRDVASLAQGVVWYPPPQAALRAAAALTAAAAADPRRPAGAALHAYGPTPGLPALRAALRRRMAAAGLPGYEPVVTPGANCAFTIALLALADADDATVLFPPLYFNERMSIQMTGGGRRIMVGPLRPDLRPDLDWLEGVLLGGHAAAPTSPHYGAWRRSCGRASRDGRPSLDGGGGHAADHHHHDHDACDAAVAGGAAPAANGHRASWDGGRRPSCDGGAPAAHGDWRRSCGRASRDGGDGAASPAPAHAHAHGGPHHRTSWDGGHRPSFDAGSGFGGGHMGLDGTHTGGWRPPKLVILVNPANPTGVLLTKEELDRAAALTAAAGAWLLIDNTYMDFCYEGREHYAPAGPHIVHLFSLSKAYGAMGWRVGCIGLPPAPGGPAAAAARAAVAPAGAVAAPSDDLGEGGELMAQILKVQDSIPICAAQLSQIFALAALEGAAAIAAVPGCDEVAAAAAAASGGGDRMATEADGEEEEEDEDGSGEELFGTAYVRWRVAGLERRNRATVRAALEAALGPDAVRGGEGAIYFFARLPYEFGARDEEVVAWLVRRWGVCLVPGSACAAPGWLRVSFANLPPRECSEAAARLRDGLMVLVARGPPALDE